jgi:phage major head subunit gpT-like protein
MAVVPTDLALGWSTQFDTLFQEQYNQSIAVLLSDVNRLLMDMELGDFQGNRVTLDWLGAAPQMRQWVDEKRAIGLNKYETTVVVNRYEATVEIDLDTLRDGKGNVYVPRIREIAANGARLPYNLTSAAIAAGQTGMAYDGQNFFSTTHSEGNSGAQSNLLSGSGSAVNNLQDDYYSARSAMFGYKDDKGIPLHPTDFRPLVWIPNTQALIEGFERLRTAALIYGPSTVAMGTNVLQNQFDLVIDPSLTSTSTWYMFRTDTIMKPFFRILREEPHYVDNFGTGHPDVWARRIGQAGVEGRMALAYGMWQTGVCVTGD